MDTLCLVDVGVFFTCFFTPFCSASFLLLCFGGLLFFCRAARLRQPFGPHKKFLDLVRGPFFFNLLWGPWYLFTPKKNFFLPSLPLF